MAEKPTVAERVRCEICRKEVPASEAIVPEAIDYLLFFCGLDCYAQWREQHVTPTDR
jgi:hypothetical protein